MNNEPAQSRPIDCPRFSVNGLQVLASSTEVTIFCTSQVVGVGGSGEVELGAVPAAQIAISPAVAKELAVLLTSVVEAHEAKFGALTSEFLQSQQASKAQ